MFTIKLARRFAAVIAAATLTLTIHAQTSTPLIDIGAAGPVPGPLDIVQLSTSGDISHPDGLNYYTDNQTGHNAGEPGQTFITPNSTNGFVLTSLAIKSAGLSDGGGSPGTAVNYLLHIYSVSGANVSLLATYATPSPLVYTEGDWLLWSNLSVTLLPGATYAYSFGKSNNAAGYDAIGVASPNPYPFGEIALIPPAGGGMTFSSSHSYDASFDIGLASGGPPTPPVVTNLAPNGIQATAASLNGRIVSAGGSLPTVTIYYGTTDGSTNAGAWQNAVSIGGQSGAFTLTVPGLSPNTAYFYTASASNSAATTWAAPSKSFTTLVSNTVPTPISVLTYHYDNTRDGANTNETALTPANVNVGGFGRLFSYPLDGHVYAQPLVLTNVNIPGQGVHDVVYVVTEHDTAYALDADSNEGANGGVLWSNHVGTSSPMPNNDFGNRYGPYHDLVPEIGITGTPVIDPIAGTIYFDAFTLDGTNGSGAHVYNHRIHGLDITTGNERPYSPVLVAASVPGRGVDSSNGVVTFTPTLQAARPALTLAGGTLYIAYSSYADSNPYHGWLMSFTTNLQLLSVFNTTPNATVADFGTNAGEASIWMGGDGMSVDANTNLYFETGNGSFSANTNGGDYGDSFMKLSTTNGLNVADYFTPFNQASLQSGDEDLGSGGLILLPDSIGSTTYPHLMIGAGKQGTLYLVNRDNLGHYNSSTDNMVQKVSGAFGSDFNTPSYFNHLIYYVGVSDVLKAFAITNAAITAAPFSRAATAFGFPGAAPDISANGAANAIAWVIQTDAYTSNGPDVLHAYNATNLSQELYNSSQNLSRDNPGGAVKFTVPTVADGKVYVGAEYRLSVFGNGIFLTAPPIFPNGGSFNGAVTVTLAGAPAGVGIYYTLDGSTPTTNSLLYTGPFALTNNATIKAIAAAPGAVNSAVTIASFVVVPPIYFTAEQFLTNGQFRLQFSGATGGGSYILEASTNLTDWVPLLTNTTGTNIFYLLDANAANYPYRFYRVLQQ